MLFTDEGDVVIDPLAGSGAALVAAIKCNRSAYGFEIKKEFYNDANKWIEEETRQEQIFKPEVNKRRQITPALF